MRTLDAASQEDEDDVQELTPLGLQFMAAVTLDRTDA
jgi:hypothetical protein